MRNVSPETMKRIVDEMKSRLLQVAQEQGCKHPSRLDVTDLSSRVVWLAAIELDTEGRTVIVNLFPEPQWNLVEFPVTFTLTDEKEDQLVMKLNAPEQDYIQ